MEPSEVPRRQPEQRWSLAEDGAELPQPVDGAEKTSLGGPCRDLVSTVTSPVPANRLNNTSRITARTSCGR